MKPLIKITKQIGNKINKKERLVFFHRVYYVFTGTDLMPSTKTAGKYNLLFL